MVAGETLLKAGVVRNPPFDYHPCGKHLNRSEYMKKLELLTVLRSVKLALKNGNKEEVENLIDELISDAQNDKKKSKE